MRIRSYLLLLAAVVVVPGLLAAAVAVGKVREAERDAHLSGLRETVRATALLVEGEVQRSLGVLSALATSPHLSSGDFAAFYEQAAAVDLKPDVWTLLLDADGRQILNTSVPFGTPPPPPVAKQRVAQVLATGKPLVTGVLVGPVSGRMLTTIYLPAVAAEGQRLVVAQAFSVDHWKKKAMQPRGRDDVVVAVIDQTGRFISRSHKTDELLGQLARPELVAAAAAAPEGLIRHLTLEGVDAYDAFAHTPSTGWTVAVASPAASIDDSATQAVSWLLFGIAGALAVALSAAFVVGRTLIGAIETASQAAHALGRGERPATLPTRIDEVDALNAALAEAGELLAGARASREVAEAERSRLFERESAARRAAEEQNAAKDQFLALLGHELRNPLAAIAGASEVMTRSAANAAVPNRFLAIVQRQTRHLAHIVDDLLEVSRLLSGKISLERRPINLAESARRCVEALRQTERAAGSRFIVDADDAWVDGDAVRIEQIVSNLVTNALKYSPAGSTVTLRVRALPDGTATLAVSDEGAGIAADLMPRIFEPFVQGPAYPGRVSSGLGIGLALVRQLVALHGGEVAATSGGEGRGSTFVLTLPAVAAPPAVLPAAAAASSSCCVLLVEDNADARVAMAELLELMGYEIVEAGDGDEALARAAQRRPDVVVMDIGLPGRDGYQIAAEMRRRPEWRGLPLIALTGYGQQRDAQLAAEAGFDRHLVKPVDPDVLASAIEGLLDKRGRAAS